MTMSCKIKIETREVKPKSNSLKGWKVEQEVDAGAYFAPNIPEMFEKTRWSEWEERFTWLPRRSIYGRFVWGNVHYRHEMNGWGKVPLTGGVKQWATKKEVFESKLRGDRNMVDVKHNFARTTADI